MNTTASSSKSLSIEKSISIEKSVAIAGIVSLCLVVALAVSSAVSAQERQAEAGLARATFAGGCFWCMEPPFDKLPGVVSTTSGYTGGVEKNPTYQQVGRGLTGHAESVQILYDPEKVSYETLLAVFWHNIDPTTADRQFCDRGRQYRPAIFFHDDAQKAAALRSKQEIDASGILDRPNVTEIVPATEFYPAEDYHQDYYKKNPLRYKSYRLGCGRDRVLKRIWGDQAGGAGATGER